MRAEAARLLAGAIRLPTPNPPGDEAKLATWLAQTLAQVPGVEARVIALGEPGGPRAALWARVRGRERGARRPLLLLSHLDVAPAVAADWAVDPWAGVTGGGYVVGRGALDAKGVTVVHMLTLVALARRAEPPARDIILLATPDEEAGGSLGARLLTRDRIELLGGAEFLLTEGGAIQPALSNTRGVGGVGTGVSGSSGDGGDAGGGDGADIGKAGAGDAAEIWSVSFTEKTPCWVEVLARGAAGHSSLAARQNASARLVRALSRVQALTFPTRVTPAVQAMFRALAPHAPPPERAHYRNLRAALSTDAVFRARFLADPGRAALVRDTAAVTVLAGSPRVNMQAARAHAHIDARLLPGARARCSAFVARLADQIADPQVTLRVLLEYEASASPLDSALLRAIERVAARARPRGVVVPRVNAGSGDAHWFREIGIHSYGFVPRRLRPEETRGVHGPNERIAVDNLVLGVTTLLDIVDEL